MQQDFGRNTTVFFYSAGSTLYSPGEQALRKYINFNFIYLF